MLAIAEEGPRAGPRSRSHRSPGWRPADDDRCSILYYRQDLTVSDWQIKSDLPGRFRVKNPVLHRKNQLCKLIERALTGVLGIDRFSTNSLTSSVLVH